MARPPTRIDLSTGDRVTLERWIRARSSPQSLVMRSQIVLLRSEGISARFVAATLGINRRTVGLWCERFEQRGCSGLKEEKPGRGRKPAKPECAQP
jgi:transposase